ncbi:hypothetical protein AZL_a02600 (plasmid) [Azospirillum sp. B510]|uniref:hypothetical protein n=1 Tax=Azospirillum sp. (strain B510) TaxID=137722 RepID=UPI0001C4BA56|nr:hypothetical protein [Azospirillum sp. B510]BAI73791.1 hypothetical protein AZL_a02600 [Azospirillum sp. B510]
MARKKKKKGGALTLILLVIPAGLIVLPTTILFGIGMIPTIVAYVVDRDPDKSAPITVGGLNFCGCMPFAIDLWKHQHTLGAVAKILADPLAWLVMYSAAAVGWGLYYGIPPLVAGMEITRAEKRVEVLKQKKVALVQEWGPDVAGDYFDESGEPEAQPEGA